MANASLNIPITGDASAFLAEINRAFSELKKFQDEFNNAFTTKGKKLKLDIDVSLVEGSIADLKAKIKDLEASRDNLPKFDIANFEAANRQIKEYKDEIKRLQGIGIKVDVEPPPPGSINDIKRQIATLGEQRGIAVGIDLTNANLKLKELKALLKILETQGVEIPVKPINPILENSIAGLEKELNDLRVAAKNIDLLDEKEIAKTNDQIKVLEGRIDRFKNLSIDPNGKLTQSSAKARQAITSLSLVAQDLPFGFIAIQNNLPAVLQTFTELETRNKGVKGSLKELGSALIGPAGVFLAFSAVTGAVTYAVKEYGSLGNAVDALFGKLDPLYKVVNRTNEAISKFNKDFLTTGEVVAQATGSTESQIIKMKALADVVTDTTKSENVRKFALQEMKGIDEARFGRYDVEKGKLAGLTQSVNAYTQSIIANSVAQKLSDRASDALIARNTQLNLYENQYKALEDIEKKYPGVSKRSEDYKKQVEQTAKLGGIPTPIKEDVELYNQAIGKLKEYKTTLNEVNKTYLSTRKEARGATDEAIKFGSALVDLKDDTSNTKNIFAPKIDVQDVDEFTNIDKVIQRVTKYGDAFIDINNSVAERSEALKKLLEVDPQYFKSFNVASKDVDTAREAIEQLIRTLNSNKLFEQQRVEGQKLNNLWEKQARDRKEALEKTQEAADNEFIERANQNNTFNYKAKLEFTAFDADLEKAVGTVNSAFKSLEDVFNDVFENIVSKNQQIANSIEGYITQPMQTLFDILTNEGEASWKDFGKVVIDVLKKIAIQAISTAIAKTLANILAPGFGSISTPSLLDYLDNPPGDFDLNMLTGGGRRRGSNSSANFGGIVGSQSMQMAGQVNMVIRGSDLVGVMNRTNTTINRVG